MLVLQGFLLISITYVSSPGPRKINLQQKFKFNNDQNGKNLGQKDFF